MPKPSKDETEKDFVSRCIPIRQHEHPKEKVNQSARVCHEVYRKHKGRKK